METSTKTSPTNVHGAKIGDTLVSSWGYDQTNIDFFRVVSVTPKSVRVLRCETTIVASNSPLTHDAVVPGEVIDKQAEGWHKDGDRAGDFLPNFSHRIVPIQPTLHRTSSVGDGRYSIRIASYAKASGPIVPGTTYRQTNPQFGH